MKPRKGEVWMVDLGIAGKVRPCLVVSEYPEDHELALATVIPHTTSLRGNRWELSIPKPFLAPGAFHFQQIQGLSLSRFTRRMGALTPEEMAKVYDKLRERFGL